MLKRSLYLLCCYVAHVWREALGNLTLSPILIFVFFPLLPFCFYLLIIDIYELIDFIRCYFVAVRVCIIISIQKRIHYFRPSSTFFYFYVFHHSILHGSPSCPRMGLWWAAHPLRWAAHPSLAQRRAAHPWPILLSPFFTHLIPILPSPFPTYPFDPLTGPLAGYSAP